MSFTQWLKDRGSWRDIRRKGGSPYLERFFLAKVKGWSAYLHLFHDSDEGPWVHDHPWWNVSIVLAGRYREWYADGTYKDRKAGDIVFRQAQVAHRIEIPEECKGKVWSLFITGKRWREWGFFMPEWTEASKVTVVRGRDFDLKGWLFPKVVWRKHEQGRVAIA